MPLDSRELLRAVNPIYDKVVSEDLPKPEVARPTEANI